MNNSQIEQKTRELKKGETIVARSVRLKQDLYLYIDNSGKGVQSLLHHTSQDNVDIAIFCHMNGLPLNIRVIHVDDVELNILPLDDESNTGYVVETDKTPNGDELRLAAVRTFNAEERREFQAPEPKKEETKQDEMEQ